MPVIIVRILADSFFMQTNCRDERQSAQKQGSVVLKTSSLARALQVERVLGERTVPLGCEDF